MPNLYSYSLDYSKLYGGIVSAIMIENLERLVKHYGNDLYIFKKPKVHPLYVNGRSWQEIAGLSESDVNYGLSIIGTKATISEDNLAKILKANPEFAYTGALSNPENIVIYKKIENVLVYTLNTAYLYKTKVLINTGRWTENISAFTREQQQQLASENKKQNTSFNLSENIINVFNNIEINE